MSEDDPYAERRKNVESTGKSMNQNPDLPGDDDQQEENMDRAGTSSKDMDSEDEEEEEAA
jgi:hypothetical protein